jgi:hypothetical protein
MGYHLRGENYGKKKSKKMGRPSDYRNWEKRSTNGFL